MNKYFDSFRFYIAKDGTIRNTKIRYREADKTWISYYPIPTEGYLKILKKNKEG